MSTKITIILELDNDNKAEALEIVNGAISSDGMLRDDLLIRGARVISAAAMIPAPLSPTQCEVGP